MIDRRQFIACSAAFAATAPRRVFAQTPAVERVIVIGAGIVGASIAYYLTKRGCDVTIIDKGLPASQASGNTFAWINAAYTNRPQSYLSLRLASLAEYRNLSNDVSFPIRWSGSLEWFQDADNEQRLADEVAAFRQAGGSDTRMIDAAAAAAIEPNLNVGGEFPPGTRHERRGYRRKGGNASCIRPRARDGGPSGSACRSRVDSKASPKRASDGDRW